MLASESSVILNLSEIACEVDYFPLQTSEESLVNYINRLYFSDSLISVPAKNEIVCFNFSGRYKYKLNHMGRGPGEYSSFYIYTTDINSDGDLLSMLNYGKILFYKKSENKFEFDKKLSFILAKNNIPSNFAFTPEQKSILISFYPRGIEQYRSIILNINGDTLNRRPNYYHFKVNENVEIGGPFVNILYKYNKTLYFKELFSDTVFAIDQKNTIVPYLILDSDGKHITPAILANRTYKNKDDINDCLWVYNIMEVSRYLFFLVKFDGNSYYEVYDKTVNTKFRIADNNYLIDDISGGVNFQPKDCSGEKFYSWVEALELKNYVSSNLFKNSVVKNPEKKKALKELADSLKETDNPVLIVVTPKK